MTHDATFPVADYSRSDVGIIECERSYLRSRYVRARISRRHPLLLRLRLDPNDLLPGIRGEARISERAQSRALLPTERRDEAERLIDESWGAY